MIVSNVTCEDVNSSESADVSVAKYHCYIEPKVTLPRYVWIMDLTWMMEGVCIGRPT